LEPIDRTPQPEAEAERSVEDGLNYTISTPIDLIKWDLGITGWQQARRAWAESSIIALDQDLSVFNGYKIYRVRGDDSQFDFPMLPHCSFGYYAANAQEAVRLTRGGKEIQFILANEWPFLASACPVHLASLILCFYDGGIKASHHVLADADDLRSMCAPRREYRLDEEMFAKASKDLGVTSFRLEENKAVVRAITLMGWMHHKTNLGIETLTIHDNGNVELSERRIMAERIFDKTPQILY
jgi:hypothetical protein